MKRYGWIALLLLVIAGLVVGRNYILDYARDIVTPDIRVVSSMRQVSVAGIQQEQIRGELEKVKFFDDKQVTYYAPSTAQRERVSVRKLRVLLTEDKQPLGLAYYTGEPEPFQSWGVEYAPTTKSNVYDLTIKLYVREDIVGDKSSEELAERYQGLALRAVWDLTHPQKSEYKGMERFAGSAEYVAEGVKESWWSVAKGGQE